MFDKTTSGGRLLITSSPRYVIALFVQARRDKRGVQVSEETVLTDPAGLHLGAGPYMLMYSRSMSAGELADLNNPEHLGVAVRTLCLVSLRPC